MYTVDTNYALFLLGESFRDQFPASFPVLSTTVLHIPACPSPISSHTLSFFRTTAIFYTVPPHYFILPVIPPPLPSLSQTDRRALLKNWICNFELQWIFQYGVKMKKYNLRNIEFSFLFEFPFKFISFILCWDGKTRNLKSIMAWELIPRTRPVTCVKGENWNGISLESDGEGGEGEF